MRYSKSFRVTIGSKVKELTWGDALDTNVLSVRAVGDTPARTLIEPGLSAVAAHIVQHDWECAAAKVCKRPDGAACETQLAADNARRRSIEVVVANRAPGRTRGVELHAAAECVGSIDQADVAIDCREREGKPTKGVAIYCIGDNDTSSTCSIAT